MTLTNVEKELIATQLNKLEESFQKVATVNHYDYDAILETNGEVREIISELKRYWIDRQ